MANLADYPLGFWISLAILAGLGARAWRRRHEAWGIPAMAVCGTVLVWYHGDVLYNDYALYSAQFSFAALDSAWWQVTWFAASFAVLAPLTHGKVNRATPSPGSTVLAMLGRRDALAKVQPLLAPTLAVLAAIWLLLSVVALLRTGFDWQGLFAPWLGHKAYPWARGRIGGGLDFLLSAVGNVYIFCLAGFGIVAALAKSFRVQAAALALVALSWPYILLDRTRNSMLAICLPGLLSLVFLRLRRRPVVQLGVLVAAFLAISWWFGFVLAHRTGKSIAAAFAAGEAQDTTDVHHAGLNMYEELCWINRFLDDGTYEPNWGHRYFAEAVNWVPRTIWSDKPTIGLDYAVARGQGTGSNVEGVYATIATGMIGQGVTNFGPWGGPLAAALLMAAWVALLARFDLAGARFGRPALYFMGLVLTFNMGRDITLLVVYPLVFGYLIVRLGEQFVRVSPSPRTGIRPRFAPRNVAGAAPRSDSPPAT